MQGPLREDLTRISTRSSVKGLYRIMQGPRREEFRGSQLRPTFCARLRSRNATRTSQRDASRSTKYRACHDTKEVQPKPAKHFVRACAVEMHMEISQEPFYNRILRKNARPKIGTHVFCEPAQSKCTWTCQKSNIICYAKILRKNVGAQDLAKLAPQTLSKPAQSRRTISQEPFHARSYRKKTGEQRAYPDLTPGLNTYRKNPSVWTHCLGKNVFVTATRENTMTNLNLFPQHPKPMLLQRRWFCIILYHDRGVPPCFSMSRHMSRRGYHMTYHTTLAFCD